MVLLLASCFLYRVKHILALFAYIFTYRIFVLKNRFRGSERFEFLRWVGVNFGLLLDVAKFTLTSVCRFDGFDDGQQVRF